MIDEELRYELSKMEYNYYKEAGIFFLETTLLQKILIGMIAMKLNILFREEPQSV